MQVFRDSTLKTDAAAVMVWSALSVKFSPKTMTETYTIQ